MTIKHEEVATASLKKMYELGFTLQQVGDNFGMSRQAVSQRFKVAGVETRGPVESHVRLSEKEIATTVKLWRTGSSMKELAALLGVQKRAVRKRLRRGGITRENVEARVRRENHGPSVKNCVFDARVIAHYKLTRDCRVTGTAMGITRDSVSKIIRRSSKIIMTNRMYKPLEQQRECARLYKLGETLKAIAEVTGLTESQVRHRVDKARVAGYFD